MMDDMITVPFTDLLSNIEDNRGRSCPTAASGIPLIATNCIKNDSIYPVYENIRYVTDETYQNWFRGHPEPNDIIFVCKGSPGRVALVPDPVPFCIAQDMVAVRADVNLIDYRYLFYILRMQETARKIENLHVGTMIPHFKKGDFGKLSLTVHRSLETQRNIAAILFSLDKKIQMNNDLCARVAELSKLNFELELTRSAETAVLNSIAEHKAGKYLPKEEYSTGGRFIVHGSNSVMGTHTEYSHEGPFSILARIGSNCGNFGWTEQNAWVNNNASAIRALPHFNPWVLKQVVESIDMRPLRSGSGQPYIEVNSLMKTVVNIPSSIESLAPKLTALASLSEGRAAESRLLERIRDMLSTHLLSGDIKVVDVIDHVDNSLLEP